MKKKAFDKKLGQVILAVLDGLHVHEGGPILLVDSEWLKRWDLKNNEVAILFKGFFVNPSTRHFHQVEALLRYYKTAALELEAARWGTPDTVDWENLTDEDLETVYKTMIPVNLSQIFYY